MCLGIVKSSKGRRKGIFEDGALVLTFSPRLLVWLGVPLGTGNYVGEHYLWSEELFWSCACAKPGWVGMTSL